MNKLFQALIAVIAVYLVSATIVYILDKIEKPGAQISGEIKRNAVSVLFASSSLFGAFLLLVSIALLFIYVFTKKSGR